MKLTPIEKEHDILHINPTHVVAVEKILDTDTCVYLNGGHFFYVAETPDQVIAQISTMKVS